MTTRTAATTNNTQNPAPATASTTPASRASVTISPSAAGAASTNRAAAAATPTSPTSAAVTEDAEPTEKVYKVVNKADYERVLELAGNKLVLLEFFAQWCGPCRLIGAKLDEIANAYYGKLIVMKVDVDDYEELAVEYNVSSMPTFVLLKNKKKLEQFFGSNTEKLEAEIVKHGAVKREPSNAS